MIGWIFAILGAVAGAALASGTMLVREKIVVDGAIKAERRNGVVTCNARVGEIERAHNQAIDNAVEEARRAAADVTAVPETPDGLKALCKASASCRDRGSL